MDKQVKLMPCPFCGSEVVHTRLSQLAGGWVTYVECSSCPAEVVCDFQEDAISNWNARAYDPTVCHLASRLKQAEYEKEQAILHLEQAQKTFNLNLAALRHSDKIAFSEYYEEELLKARQRAMMLEESLATLKRSMEQEER